MKKILLFGSMALAALAFAAPAMATTEAFWTMGGATETAAQTVELKGKAKFNTLGTGIECEVIAKVTANEGGVHSSTGHVHFKVVTSTCAGFGGTYGGCKVSQITGTNAAGELEFLYHLTNTSGARTIVVTAVSITSDLTNCTHTEHTSVRITFTTVVATPTPNATAIQSVDLSSTGGKAFVNGGGLGLANVAEGTLTVQGAANGTYGIS